MFNHTNITKILFLNLLSVMLISMCYTSIISVWFQNKVTSDLSSFNAILLTVLQTIVLSNVVQNIITSMENNYKKLLKIFLLSDVIFVFVIVVSFYTGEIAFYFSITPICFTVSSVGNKIFTRTLNNLLHGDDLFKCNYRMQRWNNIGVLLGASVIFVTIKLGVEYKINIFTIVIVSVAFFISSISSVILLSNAERI